MKSVGEAMSIGRTFKESLQKALRSLEIKKFGLESVLFLDLKNIKTDNGTRDLIYQKLRIPNAERIFYLADAFRAGLDLEKIFELSRIDRWFLHNIKEIVDLEMTIVKAGVLNRELLKAAKDYGFSDRQIAKLLGKKEEDVSKLRKSFNIEPTFKLVDTCAAEFQAHTPYFYSTYDKQD
jgi:carbamoyl-phosphate synthase large subunit